MTIGVVTTGVFNNPPHDKFHYSKTWSGGDGKTVTDRFTRKDKWNPYVMTMGRIKTRNANKLGYRYNGGPHQEVNNHTWASAGGDAGTSGYRCDTGSGTSFVLSFPASQFNVFWTAREDLELLSKLLKKIKGHELNLGVSLAEVDKLAGTVSGTLKSLVYGVSDLSKGNFASFARRFGTSPPSRKKVKSLTPLDISGRFLEMRYAWTPAINDVFEAAKAFEALSNGPRQSYHRKTVRKNRQRKYNTNYVVGINQAIEVTKTYLFEAYEEMSAARQMGLTNPATVLWERLPWSFVIDWFIPIGTYLELIGQVPFMKGRWLQTRSIRWKSSGTFAMNLTPLHQGEAPLADCDWERFCLERSPIGNPGVPFPDFRVEGAVQGKRLQNAIALAHQVFLSGGDTRFYHY